MDRFTQNLRRARKAAGLTQQQLADRLHVTRQSVSSWELGRTEPDLQTLTELAEVFETDAGSLGGSRKTGLSAPAKTLRDRLCCLRGLASDAVLPGAGAFCVLEKAVAA